MNCFPKASDKLFENSSAGSYKTSARLAPSVAANFAITRPVWKSVWQIREIQGSCEGIPGMVDPRASIGMPISFEATAASALPAESPPITATALSSLTKSRTAFSARAGSARVSRTTSRITCPMTPPLALTSSAAMARPLRTSLALPCPSPFNGRKTPTLITGGGVGTGGGVASGTGGCSGAGAFLHPPKKIISTPSRAMESRFMHPYIKTSMLRAQPCHAVIEIPNLVVSESRR